MMKRHKKRTSAATSRPRRSPSRGLRQTRGSERQTASSLEKPSVVVVMGVSGSGKSTIASMLAHRLNWIFEEGDWFHPRSNIEKMHRGEPLTDEDRWPWLEGIAAWIDATRHAGNHGTVACSALKRAYRDILVGERRDVRADEAERRDPTHTRTWVALVDGNNHQIDRIGAEATARKVTLTVLIDFIHVLESLWRAAWNFHPEADPAAETWVKDKALAILNGQASTVAAAIRGKYDSRGFPMRGRAVAQRDM